ncbi:hypothetical protein N9I86_06500, partial [Hyphomicrobiales bacterium]|nr:hypothetical protein [Hyphomicrobiales bacterium]
MTSIINESEIIEKANKNFQGNELIEAKKLCYDILIQNSESIEALTLLGLIDLRGGKPKDAKFYFEEAIKLENNDFVLFFNLAFTFHQLNELGDAKLNYEHSIKIKKNVMSLNNLASIYMEEGFNEKSIELLKDSAEISPTSPTLSNLASCLLKANENLEALEYASKALNLNEDLNEGFKLTPLVNFVNALNNLNQSEYPKNNDGIIKTLQFIINTKSERPVLNNNFFRLIFENYSNKEIFEKHNIKKNQIVDAELISNIIDKDLTIFNDSDFLKRLSSETFLLYLENELVVNGY